MIGLINLAIAIIVIGLVLGVLVWAIRLLPIPQPFSQIAIVLLVLIGCLILLGVAFGHLGGGLHFVGGSI